MAYGIETVDNLIHELSNWGRWGNDEDLGTLNHLTEKIALTALRLPRTGRVISCGRSMSPRPDASGEPPLLHHMLASGTEAPEDGLHVIADWFGFRAHGLAITHLDALNHMAWHGRLYQGRPALEVTAARGAAHGSAERVSGGVVTRGVLLDVPRALGVDWIDPASPISAEQLEICEHTHGAEVRPGDAVVIRTGRDARLQATPAPPGSPPRLAGLAPDCLRWLHERDVGLLGSDAVHDVVPSPLAGVDSPVHVVSLVGMGMWLIDNMATEELSKACLDHESWQFLFTTSPIALKNSTGAPVNPMAVL